MPSITINDEDFYGPGLSPGMLIWGPEASPARKTLEAREAFVLEVMRGVWLEASEQGIFSHYMAWEYTLYQAPATILDVQACLDDWDDDAAAFRHPEWWPPEAENLLCHLDDQERHPEYGAPQPLTLIGTWSDWEVAGPFGMWKGHAEVEVFFS